MQSLICDTEIEIQTFESMVAGAVGPKREQVEEGEARVLHELVHENFEQKASLNSG